MLNSEFKTLIYARDVQLPELPSDTVFLALLDRAIANVRAELRGFEPEKFETWLENQASPVAFPADFVRDETAYFYPQNEYITPIGSQYVTSRMGSWYVESYTTFNIKYPADIARQTSMTADFPFTTRKSEEILISEMMALINLTLEENESTPAVANALVQSNRIK